MVSRLVTLVSAPVSRFTHGFGDMGYELFKDVGENPHIDLGAVDLGLEAISSLHDGQLSISGPMLLSRSYELRARLGQWHAEIFLRQRYRDVLDVSYQFLFPGTEWRKLGNRTISIPCLIFWHEEWELQLKRLDGDIDGRFRLLRLRQ